MVGSMVKPLGLTLDNDGLLVRVQEMETSNMSGSMVFLTKEPKEVLRIVGLNRRILGQGFRSNDELYEYLTSCSIFNPAHFANRLKDSEFSTRLKDRSVAWVHFVLKWIPE
ncbi:hypothetical protein EJ04DRAFT_561501 [Polyplosphaeria fusca]|uniref:Uncharacterized protein n=1 Tax=Polyplosphaeria fusca TaxID=682080 RepID=A0A9P4R695_9PLEO|nr:hypothetical protein EJ04DRAFT_561501 [Polyplosphaeria fusca]